MNDEEIKKLIGNAVLVDEDGEPIDDENGSESEGGDDGQRELHEFEW